jgi:hypothetical protein
MTDRALSLYRTALFAPLVLGVLIIGVLSVFGDVEWINALLGNLGLVLVWVAAVCGVPWLLVSVGFLLWSKGKRDDQARRALLLLPPLVAVLSGAWWLGYIATYHGPEDPPIPWLSFGLKIGGLVLALAYAYVGLTLLLARLWPKPRVNADAA